MPAPFISRRAVLRAGAILTAGSALPRWFTAEAAETPRPFVPSSPNDRPGILLVGCGGMGLYDLSLAAKFGEVVALCDVDATHLEKAGQKYPQARKFSDFREAVRTPGVDVVINGTPDHWHTLVNLAAVKAGRDVYSEKPLTFTIEEGRRLIQAVRSARRVLQTGSQQRSDRRFRLACELVRNGRIGRLQQVITSLPSGRHGGPFAPRPVPAGLDWDRWQGQTPAVEYVPERCHGSFRYWWEYVAGTLTDWGAHHNDIALWGMGLDGSGPETIRARALLDPLPGGFSFPSTYSIEYGYANGVTHTCQTVVTEGPSGNVISEPPLPGQLPNGVKFIGSLGWIFVSRGKLEASDAGILQEPLTQRRVTLPVSDNHMGNFFDCIRSRADPICHAEIGHRSVSVCHLGAIALRLGRPVRWDPVREKFRGDAEADRWISRVQRAPYTYAYVG
jgi:predicted dehydrogenase